MTDRGVVCGAALPGVAIALDQPRALRDFERQRPRLCRRCGDQPEPGFDRRLLLQVPVCAGPEPVQLGEQQKPEIAGNRSGLDFHAPVKPANPTAAFGEAQDRGCEPWRQDLADLLDAWLEEFGDRDWLAGLAAGVRGDSRDAVRRNLGLRDDEAVHVFAGNERAFFFVLAFRLTLAVIARPRPGDPVTRAVSTGMPGQAGQ
jgi:hypothetical protein